jgi:hypothetical protein
LLVRALQQCAGVRDREGTTSCLAEYLFNAPVVTEMIGARVNAVNDDGSFTIVIYAESLREVERTAKALHPGSTVRIAFPIEPECFFAGGPHTDVLAGHGAMEGFSDSVRPS